MKGYFWDRIDELLQFLCVTKFGLLQWATMSVNKPIIESDNGSEDDTNNAAICIPQPVALEVDREDGELEPSSPAGQRMIV